MLLGVLAGCHAPEHHAADVWAVVNGTEIKRDEVEKYYRSQINPEAQEPSQEEALSLKLNVLDQLINNEILLERAKKLNLEASDGEVEDKFTELKSPFTEEEFQRQLKQRGMGVDDLKRDLRRQLSIQKLLTVKWPPRSPSPIKTCRTSTTPTATSSMSPNPNTASRKLSSRPTRMHRSAIVRTTTPPLRRKRHARPKC